MTRPPLAHRDCCRTQDYLELVLRVFVWRPEEWSARCKKNLKENYPVSLTNPGQSHISKYRIFFYIFPKWRIVQKCSLVNISKPATGSLLSGIILGSRRTRRVFAHCGIGELEYPVWFLLDVMLIKIKSMSGGNTDDWDHPYSLTQHAIVAL